MTCLFEPKSRQTLTADWKKAGLDQASNYTWLRKKGDSFIGFHEAKIQFEKKEEQFLTGSSYKGYWDMLGFAGCGTYTFPHGAVYTGQFKAGEFHGYGTITYPVGHKLKGKWKHGKLVSKKFEFADGLEFSTPWGYCQMPDRRWQTELNASLNGAGEEFLTNAQPTLDVPDGCYDTIDGFYDPIVKCIFGYDEESMKKKDEEHKRCTDNLKRITLKEEGAFIEKNYRKSRQDQLGFTPELYEVWMSGTKDEIENNTKLTECIKTSGQFENINTSSSSETYIDVQLEYCELRTK